MNIRDLSPNIEASSHQLQLNQADKGSQMVEIKNIILNKLHCQNQIKQDMTNNMESTDLFQSYQIEQDIKLDMRIQKHLF